MERPIRSQRPQHRLTRICDAMTDTFDVHPEHHDDDKCIVFLGDTERGGLVIHGYRDDTEALADLLTHIRAIFESNNKGFDIVFLDEDGIRRG